MTRNHIDNTYEPPLQSGTKLFFNEEVSAGLAFDRSMADLLCNRNFFRCKDKYAECVSREKKMITKSPESAKQTSSATPTNSRYNQARSFALTRRSLRVSSVARTARLMCES